MTEKGKEEESPIKNWLAGRTILVTGGTGFVGSVLCEKLLRSCPGLTKMYILVRGRKGMTAESRMKETLDTQLFRLLSAETKQKVQVVDGDITEPGLGLCDTDRLVVQKEVSIVFHVAASTNFSSSLSQAVNINLMGTKYTLDFTKTCPHVQGFLYVSTAYCNSMVRGPIMETVYPTWVDPYELLQLTKKPNMTESEVKSILGGHSNTYSFTKQLAEELLRRERGDLPVAIVRPSLVLGCHSEPVPGWLSNVQNGGVAFIAGAGKGVFRMVVGIPEETADIVPVDMVVSQCVAALWDVVHNKENEGFTVSHCVSGTENPVTWGSYCDMIVDAARKNPSQEVIWYPAAKCRANVIRCYVFLYLFQLLPALVLQTWESLFGWGRPIYTYQQKFFRGVQYVRFFTVKSWFFDTRKALNLAKKMAESDRTTFNFDIKRVHWPSYFETCVLGVRHYYHGDSPATLKKARKLIPLLLFMHWLAYILFFIMTSFVLYACGFPEVTSRFLALGVTAFVYWF